jgi:hypothetical protein
MFRVCAWDRRASAIKEVVEMPRNNTHKFVVGDVVRLLSVPDWLVADLPDAERAAILACVGREMTICEIDKFGGLWLGFGQTIESEDGAIYSGQSFVIEPDRIQLVKGASTEGASPA